MRLILLLISFRPSAAGGPDKEDNTSLPQEKSGDIVLGVIELKEKHGHVHGANPSSSAGNDIELTVRRPTTIRATGSPFAMTDVLAHALCEMLEKAIHVRRVVETPKI